MLTLLVQVSTRLFARDRHTQPQPSALPAGFGARGRDPAPGNTSRRETAETQARQTVRSMNIRVSMIHMKRTNLVLDGALLEEATRLSGERTYSKTVERALREMVRRAKARQILDLAGSGLWQGDLTVMREDTGVYRTRRRGSR